MYKYLLKMIFTENLVVESVGLNVLGLLGSSSSSSSSVDVSSFGCDVISAMFLTLT